MTCSIEKIETTPWNGIETMWIRLLNSIYRLHQTIYSTWIRQRYAGDFDQITTFCLFIGYPRSGHSLVGALLNAHPHIVVSHELNAPSLIHNGCARNQLYSRIIARAYWFNLRGNTSNYFYSVPNQWQGRFKSLKVIGDKRGGALTRHLAANPDFLQQVRLLVGIPVRFIHVLRNPFDNISAISIWDKMTLEESIEYYFFHCKTTAQLETFCQKEELITVYHENMIHDPDSVLSRLCQFLGVQANSNYIGDCSRIVYPSPTFTRRKISWPATFIKNVEKRLRAYPFLENYTFDDDT